MSYDAFATTFSESRKNLHWGEIDYFMEYIQKLSWDKKISILDVGCGNGRFINTLENSFPPLSPLGEGLGVRAKSTLPYSYLGIDASTGMIEEARKLHPDKNFIILDMTSLDQFSNQGKYDVIVFIASFHHLHTEDERTKVLENAKKLLSEDGLILMTNWNLMEEPNFSRYQTGYRWNGDFWIKIGEFERYYHGFTIPELEKVFMGSGYQVLENKVFEGGRNIVSIIKISK